MAFTLNDFDKEVSLTLDDFDGVVSQGPHLNERSASQLSATQTLLRGGTVQDYQRTKADLLDPASRQRFIEEHYRLREDIWTDAKSGLMDILSSDATDEEKTGALLGSQITVEKLPPLSTMDTLAEQAAITDSGEETVREENSKFNSLDFIRSLNEQKRELTSMINSLEIGKDNSILKNIKDFSELWAPLAEWNHFDRLLKDVAGSRDTVLLGSQKQKLYEQIQKIPITERARFAEELFQYIDENENVILPDGNDLLTLETLQRMLIDNDYSDFERWFDNVTSVLDIIGVGALARGAFKGAKVVSKTDRALTLAEEAEAFKNRPAEPITGLEKEALDFKGTPEPTVQDVFKPKPKNTPESLAKEAKEFKSAPEPTVDSLFRRALSEDTRTQVSPSSPSQVVKDVNPELARKMHELVKEDETGEAAKALYGTTPEEALAKDILPEPDSNKGKLPNKVEMRRPEFEEPADIRSTRLREGNTIVSEKEFGKVKTRLTQGLENVEGMVLHPSSMIIREAPSGSLQIMARYSPLDSGFTTPEEAIEHAQFAFRNYRIPPESFTILSRKGSDWVETSVKDLDVKKLLVEKDPKLPEKVPELKDIDYAIGLNYDYRFSPEDLTEVDLLTTAPGWIARGVQLLDRIPTQAWSAWGQGSLVQNILDAASVIHPQIVNAASVAVDKTYGLKKLYVDQFQEFIDTYASLPKPRRALMTDYINEANFQGLKLDTADLYSRGFTKKEVDALKQWRRANDAMWHAANDDMVKTLRSRGNKMFIFRSPDGTKDSKLVGRPISAKSLERDDVVFDPVADTNVKLTGEQIKKLYDEGGELVRLNDPLEIDGKWVDVIVSRNNPTSGYTRAIYDGEHVMAYRDGYYPVMYDANYFITKELTNKDTGKKFRKVVASARDQKELNTALKMLRETEPKSTFSFRKDRSFRQAGSQIFDEGGWSLSSSAGLSTQRFRGERLADAGSDLQRLGHSHLKDPLEAVTRQIHQLSQRVSMRTYMDTVKKRWMLNYGPYVELPRNKLTGQLEMPKSPSAIVGKPEAPQKLVADARSNYNYIYSLENGYINGIDVVYKATLHSMADFMGQLGVSPLEKAFLSGARGSPTQSMKTLAFKLFLSASPLRQAVLQRGQILQLGAVNPTYLVKDLVRDLAGINKVRLGVTTDKKYVDLFEEIRTAGILEAVDAHNLIREDMLRLADLSFAQKARSFINAPVRGAQTIGFDLAEQDNLLSAWLAFRDLAIKEGKDLKSVRVQEEIHGQARAYTLNMNRAGEMPYSQNTLGLVAQFMSFRHKALLQPFTNRSLSVKDRAKLLAYTTALFGADATVFKMVVDNVWGDNKPSEIKNKIQDGLLDTTLNMVLSGLSGKEQNIDWGDLAPTEAYGMWNMMTGMFSTDLGEMVANSPSGSLLFGSNPRLTDAFRTAMRYFNIIEDYDDPELQTRFTDVVKSTLSVYSGMSAAFKANYAYQTGQKLSSYGRISDSEVTGVEAAMALFGFRTKTETGYQEVKQIIYGDKSFETDDVKNWYIITKRHLARRGLKITEEDLAQRVASEAWRVFGQDRPRAVEIIFKEIEKDAQDGDYIMMKGIMNRMGFNTDEEVWGMINALPAGTVRDNLTAVMSKREELMENGN